MPRLLLLLAGLVAFSACQSNHQEKTYHRIVIVGNSITLHPPRPSVGWNNNWGMAASAPEKDMVHLLTARFKEKDPAAQVKIKMIARWEREHFKYDLHQLDSLRDFKPDLIIVRLGENVNPDSLHYQGEFKDHFAKLLDYMATPTTRVAVFGSFWAPNESTREMEALCKQKGIEYVPLSVLGEDKTNKAYGTSFTNPGVLEHPGDKGMQAIADRIWDNL
jgi:hypothetical protein